MSVLAENALTVDDLLASMSAGERAALQARLARERLRDKSYLELPMGREVGRYLSAKRKELSPASMKGWESCLQKLAIQFAYLQLEDLELPDGADLLEVWMDDRWGESEPGTYNVNHAIVKDFFRWQVRRQRMRSNPMELVGRARKKEIHRRTYTDDERHALIASCDLLRDRIAMHLLFDYALRKGAMRAIQFKHFDYGRRELTVFSKGSRVWPAPIPDPKFWTMLERHVLEVEARPSHYLMCVRKHIPRVGWRWFPESPMTDTPMHNWFKARLVAAGIDPFERTIHQCRHTAAQRMLQATGNLKAVQQLLHHASISTTADVYVGWDQQALRGSLVEMLAMEHDE